MSEGMVPIETREQRGTPSARVRPAPRELLRVSLWLGMVGFGGGLSVLANIRSLVVERQRWLTEREFANTVTVSQMLPGGAAANALAYIGLRFGGPMGALVAYTGFLLPGWLAVMALAWAYVRFGTTPNVESVLGGFNAAVVGVIGAITLKMMRTSVSRLWQMGVAGGALLLSLAGNAPPGEIAILAAVAGVAVDLGTKRVRLHHVRKLQPRPYEKVALPEEGQPLPPLEPAERRAQTDEDGPADAGERRAQGGETPSGDRRAHSGDRRAADEDAPPPPAPRPPGPLRSPAWIALIAAGLLTVRATGLDAELLRLGLVFFRTGLGAYGGGFAIVPHLKGVMEINGWLTPRQFADAVAIGKLTPGPVLLMGTFIGYVRHGVLGALVSTAGIFSAPFGLVVLAGTWLDRLRSRRAVRAALRGLTPGVLGLMAAAGIALGGTLGGDEEIGIAAVVALTLVRFDVNPALMLVIGGAARLALRFAGV